MFIFYATGMLLGVVGPVVYTMWRRRRPLADLGLRLDNWREAVALGLALATMQFFLTLHGHGLPEPVDWVPLAIMALMVGLFEAVFFRGFIQTRLSASFGPVGGVGAAAGLYALYHVGYGMGPKEMVFLFGLGVVYAVAYACVTNLLVLWPLLLPMGSFFNNLESGEITMPWAAILGFVDILAVMVTLIWMAYRRGRRVSVRSAEVSELVSAGQDVRQRSTADESECAYGAAGPFVERTDRWTCFSQWPRVSGAANHEGVVADQITSFFSPGRFAMPVQSGPSALASVRRRLDDEAVGKRRLTEGAMMRAQVVYESMFGNTQVIAQAVAEGLAKSMTVDLEEVGSAATEIPADIDLLVVGGPTHAFGMSRERTRESAAEQATGGILSAREGVREWLGALTGGSRAVAAAAFDTRIDKPRMPGSAAHGAEKRLRRLGFRVLVPAASFYVTGTSGPLVDGERERARHWGEVLGSTMATADEHRATP